MRLNPAELFYLSTFLLPRQPRIYPVMNEDDWHACLGVSPQELTDSLRRRMLIEPASLVLHLEKRFTKKELEALLQERGLPCEGTKADLAFRFLKANESDVRHVLGNFELLQCSEEGSALSSAYLSSLAEGVVEQAQLATILGGLRKARLFALWVAAAVLGGIIENNSDRIFMYFIDKIYGRLSSEETEGEAESASGEAMQVTEEDMERYYALYQLPVVIFLRLCLACYVRGESCPGLSSTAVQGSKENFGLASFDREYYKSKFIVLALNGNPYGGVNIYLMFQERPDRVFVAWIYEMGDEEENEFELRGFWEHEMSRDQLVLHNKEMKNFLIDKVHAI